MWSNLRWGTFLPNIDTLGLWVLELFIVYTTDGQTDRGTDKINAYCPVPYEWGHNKCVDQYVQNRAQFSHFPQIRDPSNLRILMPQQPRETHLRH